MLYRNSIHICQNGTVMRSRLMTHKDKDDGIDSNEICSLFSIKSTSKIRSQEPLAKKQSLYQSKVKDEELYTSLVNLILGNRQVSPNRIVQRESILENHIMIFWICQQFCYPQYYKRWYVNVLVVFLFRDDNIKCMIWLFDVLDSFVTFSFTQKWISRRTIWFDLNRYI